MTEIRRMFGWRHIRTEPAMFVIHHRAGSIVRQGRGLSFWFWPLSASLSLVPMDDREVPFLFQGRSHDHQDVTVQGVITYRVIDPQRLANRIDFSINTTRGTYTKQPIESLAQPIVQLAQQASWSYVAAHSLQDVLDHGFTTLRRDIDAGLADDESLSLIGIEIVSVRVSAIQPTPELERALQMPALEAIQQRADEATFQRRALAVEKERAIQENEAQTRLELARREEELIDQAGRNARREATERVAAERVQIEWEAEHVRVRAAADAEAIAIVEQARTQTERERMEIYAQMPTEAMIGLAARELATKLETIEHLSITPELFGPLLTNLMRSGLRKLEDDHG